MPIIFILLLYQLLLTPHPQVSETKQISEAEEIVNEYSECSYRDEFISFKCPDDIKILLDIPLGPRNQKIVKFIYWNEKHEQYMPTGLTIAFPDSFRAQAYIMWPEEKAKNTLDDFYGLEEFYKKNSERFKYKEMDFGKRDGFMIDLSGMNAHFEIYIDFLKDNLASIYWIVADYTSEEYEKRIDNILETFTKTVEFYQ